VDLWAVVVEAVKALHAVAHVLEVVAVVVDQSRRVA
jgi:hypothetical protein